MTHQKILILDFGSQVTQLIARRVREAHVFCEVHPCDVTDDWVRDYAKDGNLKGVILSGSHASLWEDDTLRAPKAVFELGIPVLGICFGMYAIAEALGGRVEGGHATAVAAHGREFGHAELRAHGHTKLLDGIADFTTADGHGMLNVWMSHGDNVTAMPPGFKLMASTSNCAIAGMADEVRKIYAVQFHPEVTHTTQGQAILNRFVLDICGTRPDWIMGDYIAEAVEKIRQQVGDEEVILGLSGGVDSSVAAALIHRAIGEQLTCVFVDHGLLRLNEGDMVMDMFVGKLHAKVIRVDAEAQFLGHLNGVSEPEAKRKIIGREFVEVFKAQAQLIRAQAATKTEATVALAVVGAHLSGMPLSSQLVERGAQLVQATTTAAHYRLYALPNTTPPKPGLKRVASGGAAIAVEVWDMPVAQVGSFLALIPAPLGLGKVELTDGSWVTGFICEGFALDAAQDVTQFGGWKAYMQSLKK